MKIPYPAVWLVRKRREASELHFGVGWWDVGALVRRLIRRLFLLDLEERAAKRLERVKRRSLVMEAEAELLFHGVFLLPGYYPRVKRPFDDRDYIRYPGYANKWLERLVEDDNEAPRTFT